MPGVRDARVRTGSAESIALVLEDGRNHNEEEAIELTAA